MPRARRCAHCGEKATERWDLRPCAIGRWRRFDLCTPCDLELNALVLDFIRLPEGEALMQRYREKKQPDKPFRQKIYGKPANITMAQARRAVKEYRKANA